MSELCDSPEDRELQEAPAAFRTVIAITRRNWQVGTLTFVLPSGREIRIEGDEAGPDGRLIVHDFNFAKRVFASADIGFGEVTYESRGNRNLRVVKLRAVPGKVYTFHKYFAVFTDNDAVRGSAAEAAVETVRR